MDGVVCAYRQLCRWALAGSCEGLSLVGPGFEAVQGVFCGPVLCVRGIDAGHSVYRGAFVADLWCYRGGVINEQFIVVPCVPAVGNAVAGQLEDWSIIVTDGRAGIARLFDGGGVRYDRSGSVQAMRGGHRAGTVIVDRVDLGPEADTGKIDDMPVFHK